MILHRFGQDRHSFRPASAPVPVERVAVVLNGNARAVNEALVRELGKVVADETIFVSRSPEQSKFIARTLVNRGFEAVICGGGDGTFAQCVTDVLALRPARPPAFGVLRLGTGNALATTLGSSPATPAGLAADLRLAQRPDARRELALLRVDGRLAPFAGVGIDAMILEDYNAVKGQLARTPLAALGSGGLGYGLAVATRSLWRLTLEERPWMTIRNDGALAQRVDLQGRPLGRPVPRGEVIFAGRVAIAATSTIPYYGLGLKLFPQVAERSDRFQLRIADGGFNPWRILPRLPELFRGELADEHVLDFLCTAISFRFDRPQAVQIGGDEAARRESMAVGLTHVTAVCRPPAPRRATLHVLGEVHLPH